MPLRVTLLAIGLIACQSPRPAPAVRPPAARPRVDREPAKRPTIEELDRGVDAEWKPAVTFVWRADAISHDIWCPADLDNGLIVVELVQSTWAETQRLLFAGGELVAGRIDAGTDDEPGAGFEDGSAEQREYWAGQTWEWRRFYRTADGMTAIWGDAVLAGDPGGDRTTREIGRGALAAPVVAKLEAHAALARAACRPGPHVTRTPLGIFFGGDRFGLDGAAALEFAVWLIPDGNADCDTCN